jgi:hypothetical protein
MAEWTFKQQYRRCGKPGCGSCPHGPYWYGFRKEGGRTKSRYFGKKDPRPGSPHGSGARQEGPRAGAQEAPHPFDAMRDRRTASATLARRILGVDWTAGPAECKSAFRRLSLQHHPDRGGEARMQSWLNLAWEYLQDVFRR